MSFGLDVRVDHPDGYSSMFEVVDGHTYNLAPMWCKALGINSTSDLGGMKCADLSEGLKTALVDIARNRREYEALNPANGWGDYDGFREIFTRFAFTVWEHPTGVVEWNG